MMEGITSEAASLAGHLGLGKLLCLYDDNKITIDGSTEITFTEDVGKRFEAYGWQVIKVHDGNDLAAVEQAITEARKNLNQPSLIKVRTSIGYGSPNKQDSSDAHGAPLGADEVLLTKNNLGWPAEPEFYVPEEVCAHLADQRKQLKDRKEKWDELLASYGHEYPDLLKRWHEWHSGEVPLALDEDARLSDFGEKAAATRSLSGEIMQVLFEYLPNMIGGSADLNASTKTRLNSSPDFQKNNPVGSNINFGVREHAMGGILSGLALHGGLRPFGSTFLVFFDYMKPAVRLASMMGLPVTYVYTHDSVAVGEDGPTHQPIEQLANLRSIPNLQVLRPADGRETAAAWLHIVSRRGGPSALILSRQNLPQLTGTGREALRGGYIVRREAGTNPELIIIASGSELSLALEAQGKLEQMGHPVRVVSMISRELFLAQDDAYRKTVLPAEVNKKLVIEAALPTGWEAITGPYGAVIGIESFGASAPGGVVLKKLGISTDDLLNKALEMLEK